MSYVTINNDSGRKAVFMYRKQFDTLKVLCGLHKGCIFDVPLDWYIEDNEKISFSLNPCDEASNNSTCNQCYLNLFKLFSKNKDYDIHNVIDPFNL